MDRKALREFTHNAKNFLTVSNQDYKQWVFRYTFLELEKDLGRAGDITSNSVFSEKRQATAKIIAKSTGIIAGSEEIKYFLVDADKNFRPSLRGDFSLKFHKLEGETVNPGDTIVEISGEIHDLLAIERTVLNLLMRMSGVATYTKKLVELAGPNVLITPTRKTLWGWLDKKAVTIGGGGTHRLNLSDSIIVKDTHLDLLNRNIEKAVQNIATSNLDCRFIEIEVNTQEEAITACKALSKSNLKTIGVIMFDNMPPAKISAALRELKAQNLYDKFLFEASGGITEKNLIPYAESGVDVLSLGCLTLQSPSFDASLKIGHSNL
ncbi:MAG: carboxylating nicotinate-nucleotide diphosphorylase [Candidatus Gracilibacteria bacterium]|jgi:nicotinate-nucleotide pyrophosphorylase (carboxylating)